MPDPADTTDRLLRRYEAEAAKYRQQRGVLKTRVAELEAANEKLTKDRDAALKAADAGKAEIEKLTAAAAAAPDEAAKELERLRGELRTRDHRAAFDRLAGGKIRPEALDAAWKLSGWTADGDEIDESKLTEAVAKLVADNGFLAPDGAESGGAASPSQSGRLQTGQSGAPPEKPLGAGRGAAPSAPQPSRSATADPFRIA